eukprot:Skav233834  [mRNA]  locus=scaffold2623:156193:158361:+ [translate_table: standard]
MAWLSAWRWLLSLGCEEAQVHSCQFGSPHKKRFRILTANMDAKGMTCKCQGGHPHVRIEGALTKPSAIYTDGVANHFAACFAKALRALEEGAVGPIQGRFESVLVNDILRTGSWSLDREWFWRRKSHINLLEASVTTSLLKQQITERYGRRFVICLDSAVARGALAKGRSSSFSLQPVLKRAAACQIGGNLYPSYSHAPTKLNVADDPTREEELRSPCALSLMDFVPEGVLQELHASKLSRLVANWLRLGLILTFLPGAFAESFDSPSVSASALDFGFELACFLLSESWILTLHLLVGFCQVCVFLSLGASLLSLFGFLGRCWHSSSTKPTNLRALQCRKFSLFRGAAMVILCAKLPVVGAPMVPENAAEVARSSFRASINLVPDRVVRTQTRENRIRLVSHFQNWLFHDHGISLHELLEKKPLDPEEIVGWLVNYGRELHSAGKSYTRYSETINAIVGMRPALKRQMTGAWDLAFAWLMDEPHQHHPALPMSVMLAMVSLALLWGWPTEAAVIALTWCGVLRIGEVLSALRRDLVLSSDSAPGIEYILLRVPEPKTRGRGARHQSARVDPADMVALISAVFGKLSENQKLWPHAASTLRKRFSQLLAGLNLQTKAQNGTRPYDLGSLRPGGATWLLNATEDCMLVQRRGRWMSFRVMSIYLQEIAVATTVPRLPEHVRSRIQNLNSNFPQLLRQVLIVLASGVVPQLWHNIFCQTQAFETG